MSKRLFKKLIGEKVAELRKLANMKGVNFKTTSEMEKEKKSKKEGRNDRERRGRNKDRRRKSA